MGDATTGGTAPMMRLEIGLAWSQYRQGKWSAKTTSGDVRVRLLVETDDPVLTVPDTRWLYFTTDTKLIEGDLFINCVLNLQGWSAAPLWLSLADVLVNRFQLRGEAIYVNFFEPSPAGSTGDQPTWPPVIAWGPTTYPATDAAGTTVLKPVPRAGSSIDAHYTPVVRPAGTDIQHMQLVETSTAELVLDGHAVLGPARASFAFPLPVRGSSFVCSDGHRSFIVDTERDPVAGVKAHLAPGSDGRSTRYRFALLYHPYVQDFVRAHNRYGLDALLDWSTQAKVLQRDHREFFFHYDPVEGVALGPREEVDFSYGGAYSAYNWEIFFHAPLLIAQRLTDNQRFEEAQRWFHYVFDPTTSSKDPVPRRFWKVRPLHENDDLEPIEAVLGGSGGNAASGDFATKWALWSGDEDGTRSLSEQIEEWKDNPFNPHLIARMRPIAYQKNVVMKYIDNLIAWADQQFRRDTIESINEATQLYLLAADILGPRPRALPERRPRAMTYDELAPRLDDFSNALVSLENVAPPPPRKKGAGATPPGKLAGAGGPGSMHWAHAAPTTLYFCIPPNEKLLGYWDTTADRLFKIRHAMNIEGVARQLPLFEPPIDPALLVRAAAAGIDLTHRARRSLRARSTLSLRGARPEGQRAVFRAQGPRRGAPLRAREARRRGAHDAPGDARGRRPQPRQGGQEAADRGGRRRGGRAGSDAGNHERAISVLQPRPEGEPLGDGAHRRLEDSPPVCRDRTRHPGGRRGHPPDPGGRRGHLRGDGDARDQGRRFGGQNFASAMRESATAINMVAQEYTHNATIASIQGGYERRWHEWKLQERLAVLELVQIDRQKDVASIRKSIAEHDLASHVRQIENADAVEELLRDKFTNRQLYDWTVSQVSAVYFQTYRLAYDMAKRAERAFRFERGLTSSSFVQFGAWDGLKKGLLAGERLSLDLKRMEIAYLDKNRREYEISRHVSLRLHDPANLIALKLTGVCTIRLPEALFDADYPGHYFRRIKSLSITIPCVTGPYTSVNATLTLLKSRIRVDAEVGAEYAADEHFLQDFAAVQSIATSTAESDAGVFELGFRDERYLPFEGAGAIAERVRETGSALAVVRGRHRPVRLHGLELRGIEIARDRRASRSSAFSAATAAFSCSGVVCPLMVIGPV